MAATGFGLLSTINKDTYYGTYVNEINLKHGVDFEWTSPSMTRFKIFS